MREMIDDSIPLVDSFSIQETNRDDKVGKFDNFWSAVSAVLNENDLTVAEERRASETSFISPICT